MEKTFKSHLLEVFDVSFTKSIDKYNKVSYNIDNVFTMYFVFMHMRGL